MRYEVEVRIGVGASVDQVCALAADPGGWPPMAGADVRLRIEPTPQPDRLEYRLESGLPVKDHRGELVVTATGHGGAELVFSESFRPRIWGTGSFLRARRERALIETARHWGQLAKAGRGPGSPPADVDPTRLDA